MFRHDRVICRKTILPLSLTTSQTAVDGGRQYSALHYSSSPLVGVHMLGTYCS